MKEVQLQLLREAKKLLRREPDTNIYFGVCAALGHAETNVYRSVKTIRERERIAVDSNYLRGWIFKMLGDYIYLHNWLIARGYPARDIVAKLRATRLAWIDWMIEETKRDNRRE